jgi:hypothetical protein
VINGKGLGTMSGCGSEQTLRVSVLLASGAVMSCGGSGSLNSRDRRAWRGWGVTECKRRAEGHAGAAGGDRARALQHQAAGRVHGVRGAGEGVAEFAVRIPPSNSELSNSGSEKYSRIHAEATNRQAEK